jgi:hypothetical protein
MKKFIIVLIFMALISPVFAQPISKENASDMYYVNVLVEKVFPSTDGYIVQYRRGVNGFAIIGIPNKWFSDTSVVPTQFGNAPATNSKAELVALPPGRNWPTMSIFYKAGEFSHVRLYVHRLKNHMTWGYVPQGADISKYFTDSDNIKIEF